MYSSLNYKEGLAITKAWQGHPQIPHGASA